jgi:RecA/RadA recombinase
MTTPAPDLTAALTTLRTRWGDVVGSLATVPLEAPGSEIRLEPDRVFSTGFAELDAILGPGGVPRGMGLSLRGTASTGRTTLALRLAAEAQAAGSIVAWLDLAAALDPVEAVARGVALDWLVVLTPAGPEEGLAIAGSLLAGRAVDLLVIDLPARLGTGRGEGARFAGRLGRLAALARRAGISLVVLEPPSGRSSRLETAIGEATGIRLELTRRSWIRLGRDVVGQRTEVIVARNRAGPPGRRTSLRILYADGGERDACLRRDELLNDATPPSLSPTPSPRPREAAPALRLMAGGTGRPRREAVVERERARRGSRGEGARRPARHAARVGAPAGAGGDLPRRRSGG